MTDYPKDFTADLRNLRPWPSMKNSPWRKPGLARLTFGQLHHLVDDFIVGGNLRVLDVGCGTGWLSLELAREGHDVIGIDSDDAMIQIARRTMQVDPNKIGRGNLDYQKSDFSTWKHTEADFDLIIFNRVLHHIPRPDEALSKSTGLLRPTGQIICVEYTYDRIDERTAKWIYQTRRTLQESGWYKEHLSADEKESVRAIINEYHEPARKEHFNQSDQMLKPLSTLFNQAHLSWQPYLYWDLISDMLIPSEEAEMGTAQSIMSMEAALIGRDAITPVLFCFVGSLV